MFWIGFLFKNEYFFVCWENDPKPLSRPINKWCRGFACTPGSPLPGPRLFYTVIGYHWLAFLNWVRKNLQAPKTKNFVERKKNRTFFAYVSENFASFVWHIFLPLMDRGGGSACRSLRHGLYFYLNKRFLSLNSLRFLREAAIFERI